MVQLLEGGELAALARVLMLIKRVIVEIYYNHHIGETKTQSGLIGARSPQERIQRKENREAEGRRGGGSVRISMTMAGRWLLPMKWRGGLATGSAPRGRSNLLALFSNFFYIKTSTLFPRCGDFTARRWNQSLVLPTSRTGSALHNSLIPPLLVVPHYMRYSQNLILTKEELRQLRTSIIHRIPRSLLSICICKPCPHLESCRLLFPVPDDVNSRAQVRSRSP